MFDSKTTSQHIYQHFRSIAKQDLHCHAFLSCPYEKLIKILRQDSLPKKRLLFESFQDFSKHIAKYYIPPLSKLEYQRAVIQGMCDAMRKDHVVYAEASFDVMAAVAVRCSWSELASELQKLFNTHKTKLLVSPELGLARECLRFPKIQGLVEEALDTGFFEGIDLYGDEHAYPLSDFKWYFDLASQRKLRIKCHVGEQQGPKEVWQCIEDLPINAIQHGITAVNDKKLMEVLSQRQIRLNVCPQSNVALGLVKDYSTHPLRVLFDHGVQLALGSDDLSLFHDTISMQLLKLWQTKLWKKEELLSLVQNVGDPSLHSG